MKILSAFELAYSFCKSTVWLYRPIVSNEFSHYFYGFLNLTTEGFCKGSINLLTRCSSSFYRDNQLIL